MTDTTLTPDVTVVVITYNDARRLPRAVHSVLRQTLRNLEVIIADDCSTDDTERVAAELAATDPRVRVLRLPENSGGCSAPRNAGIDAARAPYLMFLDSDDELPRHACKSLLLTAEATGVDFVTGEVTRVNEENGARALWYPELFDSDVRVVDGIARAPEFFTDHLSTNKLYRAAFIARHRLRFPTGMHYEDQLFTAKAFTLADRFAVVPWPVYTWYLAHDPGQLSISSSRHKMANVRDRVHAARLIDAFLTDSGNAALRPAKDTKFLRHDLRLYLGDLPFRDLEWIGEFTEVVSEYLSTGITPQARAELPREQRVCQYLLTAGRFEDAQAAARTLGRPLLAPPAVVRDGDRTYWGDHLPDDPEALTELDITEWQLDAQPFTSRPVRHELTRVTTAGAKLRLGLRTYDPARLLADPDGITAELWLAASGEPLRVPFAYVPAGTDRYEADIEVDLRKVPLPAKGFKGRRHPVIALERLGLRRTDILLAPGDLPARRTRLAGHSIGVAVEERGAGRLELTWSRSGLLAGAEVIAPALDPLRRKTARVSRRLSGPRLKTWTYQELKRLPRDRDLVVFEALEGRGYADSPRYIYEELVRRGLPLNAVWSHAGDPSSFPPGVPLVRRGSWEYVRTLARARYWVDSHGFPAAYGKPRGTRYLQTWHGQAFKHMGFDIPELRFGSEDKQRLHRDAVARWDLLIAPSEEFERTFVRANGYTGELLRCGLPRNDVLVRWREVEARDRAQAARVRLQIPDGRKVLLYAPTFRDGARGSGASLRVDLARLAAGIGQEWTIVVRPHYYERFEVPREVAPVVRDGRGFPDINDLLLASDALLTDYSSVMFDYANLGRPVLLFADDYEHYRNSARGAYYDLAEIAPGPVLTETGELVEVVNDLDRVQKEHADRYAAFQNRFTTYETGGASWAVVERFFEGIA